MAFVGGHEEGRQYADLTHTTAVPSERASGALRDSHAKDASDFVVCDLQTLLADAVQRVRNATFAEFARRDSLFGPGETQISYG